MNFLLHAIRGVDISIYYFLSRFAGNRILDRLVRLEETNNFLKGGVFFAIYWYLWFRAGSDRDKGRRTIIATFVGTVMAIIAVRTIAFIAPFRIRPMNDPMLTHASYS